MGRIGELDLPDRLAPYAPAWVIQLLFALLITGLAVALRAVIDSMAPAAGPFALGFPAILIATLFGRWQTGVLTGAMILLHSWYFVLPPAGSFQFAVANDEARLFVAISCYSAVILIAEVFRRAVRTAADERDRQIEERDLFLQEFDHRVKNNFTLVTSLLDMQRRRADPATAEALASALSRIESIARAHRHLYRGGGSPGTVDMATYLHELCTALSDALMLRGAIQLECSADHVSVPRDRAVSIGLVVNELVTNATKHAFADRDAGTIRVAFEADAGGWRLIVRDDGTGMSERPQSGRRDGGLGQRLVEAFARQANGTIATDTGPEGTTVTLQLAP